MPTTTNADINQTILVTLYLKRDLHENGQSLLEYVKGIQSKENSILTHEEFTYQFGTIEEEMKLVKDYVTSKGLTIEDDCRLKSTVKVSGTIGTFNNIFSITLQTIVDEDRTYITHDGDITIPTEISSVVENVLGLDNKIVVARPSAVKFVEEEYVPPENVPPGVYIGAVTPVEVANAYNLPAGDGYGGCIGIYELTYSGYQTGWNQTDVNNSFSRIGIIPPTIVTINTDGVTTLTTSDAESMLDIYCAGAVAPRAKIAYYNAPNSFQGVIDNFLTVAADTTNSPSVISCSWAFGDYLPGSWFGSAMAACSALGITVLVASGDAGAQNFNMYSPYGITTDPSACICGGTTIYLSNDKQSYSQEIGWSGSGGGISNVNTLPDYQIGCKYTTKTLGGITGTPTQLPKRGVPDISAPSDPGTGFQFYVNGFLSQYGGTSAAAPWLAGMIVRFNVLIGKRMGHVNEFFYANPSTYRDTALGDNVRGYANGYTTTADSWDAVTGLGSPYGPGIYTLLKKEMKVTYPKVNYGYRSSNKQRYPRYTTGVSGRTNNS